MKKKIQFSLDAFGTGFTNINSMANYPFSMVKISRTMIWNSMENEKAKTIFEIMKFKDFYETIFLKGINPLDPLGINKSIYSFLTSG